MPEEIKELDNKYLVLKWEDVHRYLISGWQTELARISLSISEGRKADGKPQNQYLVLNLEDEIDLQSFFKKTEERIDKTIYWWPRQKIKDIAVDIVNAILKAKGD